MNVMKTINNAMNELQNTRKIYECNEDRMKKPWKSYKNAGKLINIMKTIKNRDVTEKQKNKWM